METNKNPRYTLNQRCYQIPICKNVYIYINIWIWHHVISLMQNVIFYSIWRDVFSQLQRMRNTEIKGLHLERENLSWKPINTNMKHQEAKRYPEKERKFQQHFCGNTQNQKATIFWTLHEVSNIFCKNEKNGPQNVIYWPLTEPSIKRCTCVNKRKKKRKQVGVMKEYRQLLAAVELVGDRKASLQTKSCDLQRPPVEQPQPRCGRSAAIVRRRIWVNIAVCPCLYSSLTHHRNIENKVWEIDIFIKKRVCSFIEIRKLRLITFPLIFVLKLYNKK